MINNQFFIVCPWCGNRWYQEEKEPRRCKVCKHYCWEGTPEMHMKFEDLTAWDKYEAGQDTIEEKTETAFDRLKKAFPDYF